MTNQTKNDIYNALITNRYVEALPEIQDLQSIAKELAVVEHGDNERKLLVLLAVMCIRRLEELPQVKGGITI